MNNVKLTDQIELHYFKSENQKCASFSTNGLSRPVSGCSGQEKFRVAQLRLNLPIGTRLQKSIYKMKCD